MKTQVELRARLEAASLRDAFTKLEEHFRDLKNNGKGTIKESEIEYVRTYGKIISYRD